MMEILHILGFHSWYYNEANDHRRCLGDKGCGKIQYRGNITGKWKDTGRRVVF